VQATKESPTAGLEVYQPIHGFRYGSESFWLAGFALENGVPERVVDLGTGSGIIAGLFAAQGVPALGVDIRSEWTPYWKLTLEHSSCARQLRLECADVADLGGASAPLVVANPPFFRMDTGPSSPDPWKRAARTEVSGGLMSFVRASAQIIDSSQGRICFVLPVQRLDDALHCAEACGLHLWRSVRVGKKRVLLEWGLSTRDQHSEAVSESDPRISQWYALACAAR